MPDKDILLLDPATAKPECRKEFASLFDQSTIKGSSTNAVHVDTGVVASAIAGSGLDVANGKLVVDFPTPFTIVNNTSGTNGDASSGAGTTASPLAIRIATNSLTGIAYATRSSNIPTDMDRNDSDISPAAVKKMIGYIKPVASTGALNAAQLSADAIELPMFSNFSCTGGTNGAPKWTMPVAGGGTCDIDLGAYGGGGGYTPGQVVFSGTTDTCVPLTPGVYTASVFIPAGLWGLFDRTVTKTVLVTGGVGARQHSDGNYIPGLVSCAIVQNDLLAGDTDLQNFIVTSSIAGYRWQTTPGELKAVALTITYVGGI